MMSLACTKQKLSSICEKEKEKLGGFLALMLTHSLFLVFYNEVTKMTCFKMSILCLNEFYHFQISFHARGKDYRVFKLIN